MFYKKEVRKVTINKVEETIISWHVGIIVHLPNEFDNVILDENNKQSIDGWEWRNDPPQEYLEWLETQEEL